MQGAVRFGLLYKKAVKLDLMVFIDNDYTRDQDDKKNTSRYIFMMGSGIILLSLKKQPIISLSTIEVKFVAETYLACQAIWLRKILKELYFATKIHSSLL